MKYLKFMMMGMLALAINVTTADAQTRKPATRTTVTKPGTKPAAKPGTKPAAVKPAAKPTAVDMGLSVKWCDMDLGATSTTTAGKLYDGEVNVEQIMGEGWRIPTTKEFYELIDNSICQIITTPAGDPSHYLITSKKNGAVISLYIPKVAAEKPDGTKQTNPTVNQGNKVNFSYIRCAEDQAVLMAAATTPAALKSRLQQGLDKANVTSKNVVDWPEDLVKFFSHVGDSRTIFAGSLSCFSSIADLEVGSAIKCVVRPVYLVNDED